MAGTSSLPASMTSTLVKRCVLHLIVCSRPICLTSSPCARSQVIRQTPSAPAAPASPRTSMSSSAPVRKPTGEFNDLEHSWVPTKGHATSAADYADLAAKKDEAERRRAEREARSALEAREAEVERRERAIKLKQEEKEKAEAYRRQLADQDMKRRAEKERERLEKERKKNQPKRPPFDYAREKPQIQLAIANASSAAIALVNACRVGLDIRYPICF
jgi:hypothetical protein